MPRCDVKRRNPEHYARVKADQDRLDQQYFQGVKIATLCPFCGHRVGILCRGTYGPEQRKCDNCGEEVKFPPIQFRRLRSSFINS